MLLNRHCSTTKTQNRFRLLLKLLALPKLTSLTRKLPFKDSTNSSTCFTKNSRRPTNSSLIDKKQSLMLKSKRLEKNWLSSKDSSQLLRKKRKHGRPKIQDLENSLLTSLMMNPRQMMKRPLFNKPLMIIKTLRMLSLLPSRMRRE